MMNMAQTIAHSDPLGGRIPVVLEGQHTCQILAMEVRENKMSHGERWHITFELVETDNEEMRVGGVFERVLFPGGKYSFAEKELKSIVLALGLSEEQQQKELADYEKTGKKMSLTAAFDEDQIFTDKLIDILSIQARKKGDPVFSKDGDPVYNYQYAMSEVEF